MQERTYLEALLQGRCPKCREGKIFKFPATNLSRFSIINNECPKCSVRLEPEPGFYQGAMYVSYGLTVGMIVVVSGLLYLFGNPPSSYYIGMNIGCSILLAPFNFRFSRILYLYWFGGLRGSKN